MRKLLDSPWQTLNITFALTPIGQLHQSPPSPVPGVRCLRQFLRRTWPCAHDIDVSNSTNRTFSKNSVDELPLFTNSPLLVCSQERSYLCGLWICHGLFLVPRRKDVRPRRSLAYFILQFSFIFQFAPSSSFSSFSFFASSRIRVFPIPRLSFFLHFCISFFLHVRLLLSSGEISSLFREFHFFRIFRCP